MTETFDQRFFAAIEKHRRQPFAWGKSDCVVLALDAIAARTGRRRLVKPTWRTEKAARAALAAAGFADVEQAVAAHLEEIPVLMAGRGDIGIVDGADDGGPVLVVNAGQAWFGKSPEGPAMLPLRAARRAFRAG